MRQNNTIQNNEKKKDDLRIVTHITKSSQINSSSFFQRVIALHFSYRCAHFLHP